MRHIETHFLIDYENVGGDGFDGCDKLNKTDHIHLFYTENAKKIDLDIFDNHGDAEIVTHKVPAGKQSADIHLSSFLGYLIGVNKGKDCCYIVVSKDTDFDNVIKFWKEEESAKVSRVQKIKQPAAKPATPKLPIVTKSSQAKSVVKVSGANKTNLDQEVQKALSTARFDNRIVNEVAALVASHYGEDRILNTVHNELRAKYTNYLEIYDSIKGVVGKYAPVAVQDTEPDKSAVNNGIQQLLSKAGLESEVINFVASVVVRNIGVNNGKQQIYRTIISKYGQNKGLNIYNHIKKHI